VAGQKIIPQQLAYRLETLVNLRDALVQDADALDHDLLFDHLHQRLDDLGEFADTVDKR